MIKLLKRTGYKLGLSKVDSILLLAITNAFNNDEDALNNATALDAS